MKEQPKEFDLKGFRLIYQLLEESKKGYVKLQESGMAGEFHPELTGDYEKDKSKWFDIYISSTYTLHKDRAIKMMLDKEANE